ncbi:MAG: DUF333 domain-containing protein [archaeon]|nr:MAG: DUF333 domain-containing protein [archaeon]
MRLVWVWTSVFAFLLLSGVAYALPNPAAVYCRELGHEYRIERSRDGERGICRLPDMDCDGWDFLGGRCGRKHSYCVKHGHGIKSVSSGEAVCVVSRFEEKGGKVSLVTEDVPLGGLIDLTRGCPEVKPKGNGQPVQETAGIPRGDPPYNATDFSCWDWRDPPEGTVYNQGNFTYFDSGSGWLTPVKDQGLCGSCWAFSSVGNLEARHEINEKESRLNPDLSEEYLVSDCHDNLYQDCCGGWMEVALNFTTYEGITDESCFPYVDASGCTCPSAHNCDPGCAYDTGNNCSDATCSDRCSDYADRLWKVGGADYSSYWTDFSNEELEQWLIDRGPLTIAIYMVDNPDAQGFIDCGAGGTSGHAVILAGYNDTGNNSTSYWILKNSWGSGWGDNGYFKIRFDDNCNVGDEVHYINITNTPEFKPIIQLYGPEEGNETNYAKVEFNFTVENRNSANSTCDLIVNNNITNSTTVTNGTSALMSHSFAPGNYEWGIRCWEDNLGIINSSETRNLSVMVPPGINITSPGNHTYEILPLDLNISTNESADWCGWNLNGTMNDSMSGSVTTWWDSLNSAQGTQKLYVYCNDSVGNMGSESLRFTYCPEEPRYWDNSTNSSGAGENVEFRLRWTDNTELSGYVFGFDNGTGAFSNDTWTGMKGIGNWSNVTKTVNSSHGTSIRWKVYANDTADNWNTSQIFSFLAADQIPPVISNTSVIPGLVKPNYNVTVVARITDNDEVDYAYVGLYNASWYDFYQDNMSKSQNEWSRVFNVSSLDEGVYYLNITAADNAGNNATEWAKNITVNQTSGADLFITNTSWSTTGDYTLMNMSSLNLLLEIQTLQNLTNTTISAASYTENPVGDPEINHIGKYLQVETSSYVTDNLLWVIVKLFYADENVTSSGLEESSLRLFYYNETGGSWSEKPGGVNTSENYVWGNTTHFSFYGIFGVTTTTTTTTLDDGNGGGGRGRPATTTTTVTSTTATTTTTTIPERVPLTGQATEGVKQQNITGKTETDSPAIPIYFLIIPVAVMAVMIMAGGCLVKKRERKTKKPGASPKKPSPESPVLNIRQILSRSGEYLGKKVVVEDRIKPVQFLPDSNMTLYEISDGTGKIRGLSSKSGYEGEGTVEGFLRKDRKGFYLEF